MLGNDASLWSRDQPRLAADGAGNWVAVWASWDDLRGTIGSDEDILVSRSTDGGATWTPPAALNSNAASDPPGTDPPQVVDQSPALATDGAGNWVTAWRTELDEGGGSHSNNGIMVSLSTDNGATWTDRERLPTPDIGGYRPHVATDGLGHWVAVMEYVDELAGTGVDSEIFRCTSDALVATPARTWDLYR